MKKQHSKSSDNTRHELKRSIPKNVEYTLPTETKSIEFINLDVSVYKHFGNENLKSESLPERNWNNEIRIYDYATSQNVTVNVSKQICDDYRRTCSRIKGNDRRLYRRNKKCNREEKGGHFSYKFHLLWEDKQNNSPNDSKVDNVAIRIIVAVISGLIVATLTHFFFG